MKKSNFLSALILGAALAVGTVGCKHKPTGITPIPDTGMKASSNGNGLEPGSQLPNGNPANTIDNTGGLPQNHGLWDQPHDEDYDKFKADTVYFDTDSATIKKSEHSKLQDVADQFKSLPAGDALTVEGYCDERGTEQYNLALGDRRALAVREYLANLGVDSTRVHTVTYGEAKPVDPGHNEAAWKKNRRGVIVLLTPK